MREQFVSLSEQLQQGQQKLEEENRKTRELQQKLGALTSRRDTMQEMKDDFDGFMLGVRTILKARENETLQGVHGAVAELIKVPANYETAIEIALGGCDAKYRDG